MLMHRPLPVADITALLAGPASATLADLRSAQSLDSCEANPIPERFPSSQPLDRDGTGTSRCLP